MKLPQRLLPILALAAALNTGSAAPVDTWLPARGATPAGRATTFEQVTAQLEPGGDVYAYVSTHRWMSGLATNLAILKQLVSTVPVRDPNDRVMVGVAFDLLGGLVQASGLEQVTGAGYSSIGVGPDLNRSRIFIHHGGGTGFVWRMAGNQPHDLTALKLFPSNSVFAAYGDCHLPVFWGELERQLLASKVKEVAGIARAFPQQFEAGTGMAWDQVMASIKGELGFAITFDPKTTVTIPTDEGGTEIPTPGLLLSLRVGDELLHDHLVGELKKAGDVRTFTEAGVTITARTLPLPLPMPVAVSIARCEDHLLIGTSPALLRQSIRVIKGTEPGLGGNAEFVALAKFLPDQGNQVTFVSQRLSEVVLQAQARLMGSQAPPEVAAMMEKLKGGSVPFHEASVGRMHVDGWSRTAVGNGTPGQELLLVPLAATATSAALLLPALAKAKSRAQSISGINNLKQIGLAFRLWVNDHDDTFPPAAGWCETLGNELPNENVFKDPAGPDDARCGFAYNTAVAGRKAADLPPDTVLVFESNGGWNHSGGREALPPRPRAGNGYRIGFVDGSVKVVPAASVNSLRWKP